MGKILEISANLIQGLSMMEIFFCWIHIKWGIVVDDLTNIIPVKFGSNWPCTFVASEEIITMWNVDNDNRQA